LPEAFYNESRLAFYAGWMLHRVKKTRQNKEMSQEKSFPITAGNAHSLDLTV
jgi:hypothetical protein